VEVKTEVLRTSAKITDSVLVAFTGGKDSSVVLDLSVKFYKKVKAFFMYLVKDLEFQEKYFDYIEKRYNIEIIRVPHFTLSDFYRRGTFRSADWNSQIVSVKDIYNYVRNETGIYWIAGGERIYDSFVRRAMIKKSGTIDNARGRIFPIAYWKKSDIMRYIKMRRIKLTPEYKKLGYSFRSLEAQDLVIIKKYFAKDYEKIKQNFPLVDMELKRYETKQISKLQNS